MIQGVIFDLGYTLIYLDIDRKEFEVKAYGALEAFLREHGIVLGQEFREQFHAQRAKGRKLSEETEIEHTVEEALYETLTQLGISSLDEHISNAVARYFEPIQPHLCAYPEAIEAVQALHLRGLRTGIISNADNDGAVQRPVVQLGFKPYMDPILSSAGMRWRKPNPNIFRRVAEQWSLRPEAIAMVGDTPAYDILGAHRAGMLGILINRHENYPWQAIPGVLAADPAIQPDATVNSLLDLPAVIERM